LNYRRFKYSPIFTIRGEYSAGGGLDDSDIIGSIENCIAVNVAKLTPQVMRKDARGMTIKDDYLARLLSLRWAPELSAYDALYKMAATLVRKSNAFAAVMYNEDFTKVKQIVPLTVSSFRIYEDDAGNILFRFTWDYDGKTYVLPYQSVIHIRARFSKKRFIGTPPDQAIQTTLELLDATGQALKNTVKNSANLKGYLKYNNFADEDELKKKVQEFQAAYMSAENDGGIGGLDNTMEFHEITQRTPNIPTIQSQYLRDNLYRYYNVNENILMSKFTEAEWNAFYESVIEPIALQLSLEFTFKLLTERERGFGNKIIFTSNRLQYATLQTRATIGSTLYDRGIITINEYRELMYYEPIEDGDVRMVSLNYVKADDQSLYQTGQANGGAGPGSGSEEPPAAGEGQQAATAIQILKMFVPVIMKGGEKRNANT
jgi:HK97 family phage portal protein